MEPGQLIKSIRGNDYLFSPLENLSLYDDFIFRIQQPQANKASNVLKSNFNALFLGEEKLALFNSATKSFLPTTVFKFLVEGKVRFLARVVKYDFEFADYRIKFNASKDRHFPNYLFEKVL